MKHRILHVLFWSVISAAFIGPGTVTTAASAGAGFGYSLIWALLFSTLACFILQEASARITSVSGLAIQKQYRKKIYGKGLAYLCLISILTGCAAFEAGNIIGAASGVELLTESIPRGSIVLLIVTIAALMLWIGTIKQIATTLGLVVAFMGLCFLITAFMIPHQTGEILSGAFTPSAPEGSGVIILGLIGTTVVPYNIFLGSGLKHTQTRSEMRIGLGIAIGLGGLISIAVLLTATAITDTFTFDRLADALSAELGAPGRWLLGLGLFGAGISSTLTAALAASVTAKSLLEAPGENNPQWVEKSLRFRTVWISVLLIGLFFGLLEIRPEPAIVLAQALNGLILPLIAVILFFLMNQAELLPQQHQNGTALNVLTANVVCVTVVIGLTNLGRAIAATTGWDFEHRFILIGSLLLFSLLLVPIIRRFRNQ
ncbi:MAG: divalent metal cation transporter [Bacteroidetes bacterium]|jgi:Mn2+/Fe2+ NRAMP family transporter|nr:divalent metal cation transporter [Bacteroidota bacterium]